MRVRRGSAGHRDPACYDALPAAISTTWHRIVARDISCNWCQDQVTDAKSARPTGFVREGGFEHRQTLYLPVALRLTKAALTRYFASDKALVITGCRVPC